MADGVESQDETGGGEAPLDTSALAVSLALDEARNDPGFREEAAAFLREQRTLIGEQRHHAEKQFAHLRLRIFSDRVRLALQLVSLVAVTAVALIFGVMIRDALADHSLVIDGFSAPQSFVDRGVTGVTLAQGLMTRISAIRAVANENSLDKTADVRANDAEAIKVDLPGTGLSLGDIERFLHRRLGRATSVAGELRDDGAGQVAINLNIAGAPPISVKGSATDIDALMQSAAEKVFQRFDPGNYVIYLDAQGRHADVLAAVQSMAMVATRGSERAGAYSLWSEMDGDRRRALERDWVAIREAPKQMYSWMEAARISADLGHDQAVVTFARRLQRTRPEDQPGSAGKSGYRQAHLIASIRLDAAFADYAKLDADRRRESGYILGELLAGEGRTAALRHDLPESRGKLALAEASSTASQASLLETRWTLSAMAGDWGEALAIAHAVVDAETANKAKAETPDLAMRSETKLSTVYRPWLALSEAMTGDLADAQTLIAATPLDCYLCIRTRGKIAAAVGDRAGADGWFAEAARRAPELPAAFNEWGEMLLARGDLAGALARFAIAQRNGPHWADPLKGAGDVLARQGRWGDAVAKYDAALKFAPNWMELRAARAAAAKRAG